MKERLKKFFNKDRIFVFICLLCIIVFCVLYAILYANDKKQVSDNSTIILHEDANNLNKSYSIDSQGNLVGDNLFNIDDLNYNLDITKINDYTFRLTNDSINNIFINSINFESNTQYSFRFNIIENVGNQRLVIFYTDNTRYDFPTDIANDITLTSEANKTISSIGVTYGNGGYVTYSYLMINKGSSSLPWEPYGVWYSESNYDNVNNQLQLQSEINKYGWLSYIDNVLLKINNNNSTSYEFTLEQLKTNNYIGADSSFNLYTLSLYNNPNYYSASIDIYFANSILNSDELPINLFNVSTKEGFNGTITLRDSDSQVVVLNVQGASSITYLDIIEANSEFSNSIYNVTFDFVSPDSATLIFANSNYSLGFQSGFNKGYNNAFNSLSKTINDLTSQVSTLTNDFNNLNTQYDTLQSNYNTLLYQYNNLTTDKYTFTELFWSISAVPFGILTSGFNVNVLGFNLAAVITGLFTSLLLIWLIKKFFK